MKPMKFIQITDFHLVPPGKELFGLKPTERVSQCLADITRWHADADFCVITGDLTHDADPAAYAWLANQLASFPLRTFIIPGNHDERAALIEAFPHIERDANGFIQYSHKTDTGTFLFLDTLKGSGSEGAYCSERRAWLKDQLALAKGEPVWIFMHHPPFDVGIPYMDRIKLEEPGEFSDILASHSDIRHIFFGHIHRATYINWCGIPCTCVPGTSIQIPFIREAVGGARLSVEPAMYAVATISHGQTSVLYDACLDRRAADMG